MNVHLKVSKFVTSIALQQNSKTKYKYNVESNTFNETMLLYNIKAISFTFRKVYIKIFTQPMVVMVVPNLRYGRHSRAGAIRSTNCFNGGAS